MTGSASQRERAAAQIVERLVQAGYEAYFAGGCVRDRLLGRTPGDYDIATNARPEEVAALFRRTREIGKAFGVVLVPCEGHYFEVATFRRDKAYTDGRRPEGVVFCGAEEDARRRDFTVNALFLDPVTGRILDYVEGRADLERRILRAVGDPLERFREDGLRMLRAVRLASTLEFDLHPGTAQAIRLAAGETRRLSKERIRDELTRLLVEAPRAGQGLLLLDTLGLLDVLLPEVAALRGLEQPRDFHPEGDVLTHTVMMLDAMCRPSPRLAWSVLLHDIGKPVTASRGKDPRGGCRMRFDRHAQAGGRLAGQILRRLRFSRKDIESITHCVAGHMRFMEVQRMRKATLRRLVASPTFETELALHRLDCLCSHGSLDNHDFLADFARSLREEPVLPARWIDGHDILALGIAPGPEVGRLLRQAYEAQIEGRFEDRQALLEWIRKAAGRDGSRARQAP